MPLLHALEIGETAHGVLDSEPRGTVIAAVSNALYLLSERGELFWLAAADISRHSRGIRVSGPLPRLAVNAPFVVNGHGIIIASDAVLDCRRAFTWRAPRISTDDALPITCLPERLCIAFSALDGLPSPTGFGSIIPEIMSMAQNDQVSPLLPSDPLCSVRASCIGQRARDLLGSPGYSGGVLAVVSKATYLAGPGGEILWLAHEVLPAHRRCIQAPFQAGGLRPGMESWVQHKKLVLGDRVAVDLANAVVWEPSAICPGQAPPLLVVNTGFRRLLAALEPPETAKGLGQTIPLIAALASGSDHPPTFTQDLFVARALRPITRVARACLGRDMRRIAEESEQLVGLGPGLTPSGDDYLGGLLFAAHHLKAAYPTEFSWGVGPVLDFLHQARPLTNRISHTILSDCAQGHGSEPLHDLLNSLLQAEPVECLLRSVDRLTGIGHTSGWDMLAGTLTGMLLTEANM